MKIIVKIFALLTQRVIEIIIVKSREAVGRSVHKENR